jgi:CRISPR-associated protein Cas5t
MILTDQPSAASAAQVVRLHVEVPVTSFRVAQAREYWETYPIPPPATVYGMLLSLVGEEDRYRHVGSNIAVALVGRPELSVVLRTLWRVKSRDVPQGVGSNKRPDFQELLTGVVLSVWLSDSSEEGLSQRVAEAIAVPSGISRFGGLSLGESVFLVDTLRPWRAGDPEHGRLLVRDVRGDLSLPVWVDHVGSKGTVWQQFWLQEQLLPSEPPAAAWVQIAPPG